LYLEWTETRRCFITIAFQLALEYAFRKVQGSRRIRSEWGTSLLVYAYDVNLFGEILSVIMKITESLLGARKEVGVEVNVDKLSMCSCLITMLQTE
jgi:hypothetical protein